jgi:hypothetical protein
MEGLRRARGTEATNCNEFYGTVVDFVLVRTVFHSPPGHSMLRLPGIDSSSLAPLALCIGAERRTVGRDSDARRS